MIWWEHGKGNLRHQDSRERHPEGRDHRQERGHAGAETGAGDQAREDGEHTEEECHDVEHPTKAPHVEVVRARRAAPMVTNEILGRTIPTIQPRISEWQRRRRATAVGVALTTDVEVRPLRDGSCVLDARGVGLQEVDLVEGCDVYDSGEDDEEHHHQGAAEEDP